MNNKIFLYSRDFILVVTLGALIFGCTIYFLCFSDTGRTFYEYKNFRLNCTYPGLPVRLREIKILTHRGQIIHPTPNECRELSIKMAYIPKHYDVWINWNPL